MIRLYPEQLAASLQEKLRAVYLLSGDDSLLVQESHDTIYHTAKMQGFHEHYSYSIDTQTAWTEIFNQSQALSLFSNRQILTLQLPENAISSVISEKLITLADLLHSDLLLIMRSNKLNKTQENSTWFKALLKTGGAYVNCTTPSHEQLPYWIKQRAKTMQLQIDPPAIQLLCYCYEGNLLALMQALQRLSLLYPDGKLTLPRVEKTVNDAAHFTAYHWLDALLAGKSRRAWHILHQLYLADVEPLILLRTLQRDLLLLLQLHRQLAHTALKTLFDQYKIWQNRRPLLSMALKRLSAQQVVDAIRYLTQLELILKQDYGQSIWDGLESLSMLLCGKIIVERQHVSNF